MTIIAGPVVGDISPSGFGVPPVLWANLPQPSLAPARAPENTKQTDRERIGRSTETPGRTGNSENVKAVELGTACGFAISPVFTEQRLSLPRHRFSPLWLLVRQADFNSELHPFNIAEFTVGRIVCMANP